MDHKDFEVKVLGKGTVKSPFKQSFRDNGLVYEFVKDTERILHDTSLNNFLTCQKSGEIPISFEKAGPREFLFFEPAKTKVAIVTCGGLCPGLNNVIRSIVNHLHYRYNVCRIIGIQYGYEGFIS